MTDSTNIQATYDALFKLTQITLYDGTIVPNGGVLRTLSKQPTITDLNGAVLNLAQDALNKHNAVMAKLSVIEAKIDALPH